MTDYHSRTPHIQEDPGGAFVAIKTTLIAWGIVLTMVTAPLVAILPNQPSLPGTPVFAQQTK